MRPSKISAARLAALALAAVGPIAASCGPRPRTVRIAVAAPLTGDLGTEGQGLWRAVELAVEEANASRRFPFRLEAEPYDDRADPDEAVNVASLIIADPRIVAVIGHYNSGCAIAAARVYASAPIAMVTPSATTPELTLQQARPGWPGPRVVFRICPTDDVQGTFAAEFAFRRLGRRRICLVHDGTPYGEGLAAQFARTLTSLGGKVLSQDAVPGNRKDFRPLLARLKGQHPDAIYFGGLYTQAGLLVRQMREAGLTAPLFLSGDGAKTPGLFDVAGAAADGAYLTAAGVPAERLPGAKSFLESYRRRWAGSEGVRPYDHLGYEAAQIIFDAMESVGPDRRGIVEALRRTRHAGLSGTIAFDEKGDSLNKAVMMTRARARDRTFPAVD